MTDTMNIRSGERGIIGLPGATGTNPRNMNIRTREAAKRRFFKWSETVALVPIRVSEISGQPGSLILIAHQNYWLPHHQQIFDDQEQ
jgi:hypothetical protein